MDYNKLIYIIIPVLFVGIISIPAFSAHNSNHCDPICGFEPPDVEITSEIEGKGSILVKWLLPISDTNSNFQFNYKIERSFDNGTSWSLIHERDRNFAIRTVDHNNDFREVNFFLDTSVFAGNTYLYRVLSQAGQGGGAGNIKFSTETAPIEIPSRLDGYLLRADGFGVIKNNPRQPQLPFQNFLLGLFLQPVHAVSNAIFVSSSNPQNEVFEIALTPIPTPSFDDDQCVQVLDIRFQRNLDSGQNLTYTVTILENDIVVHQFEKTIHIVAKRIFNDQYFIALEDQVITDFENLEVQVDIVGGSGDPRTFSLYGVDFYIPEDNGAC